MRKFLDTNNRNSRRNRQSEYTCNKETELAIKNMFYKENSYTR